MKQVIDVNNIDFTRLAVIGSPGSGKTTFCNKLGVLLNRQVVHLDRELWQANWQLRPKDERIAIHQNIIDGDSWLIDGMWGSLLVPRFLRATTVIFLDYRTLIALHRAEKRRKTYNGTQRDDIAEGCVEKERDWEFIKYIIRFKYDTRHLIYKLHKANPQVNFVVLTAPKQADKLLNQIKNNLCNGSVTKE